MKRDLRIVFMGTPEFAIPSLEALVEAGHNVVAVITAPDKPAGRGKKLTPPPVKEVALKHNIPVLQPTNLKSEDFYEELMSYEANLQVVVAFRMLPEKIWSYPEYGTFNLHGSLLPQYRGAAPINWAVMNNEPVTGVTTFFLKHQIDTGDILFKAEEAIQPDDTAGTVYERLMHIGGKLVVKTVDAIQADDYELQPQTFEGELKEAPKIFRETCEINWEKPATELIHFIRGLAPYPAAWTTLDGKVCKIYKTEISSRDCEGAYNTDGKTYLDFKTGEGVLSILELQIQGKKKMAIQDFLRGYRFSA